MTSTVAADLAVGRSRTWLAVVAVTVAGTGFNVVRIVVGLDRSPLWHSLVAFAALGAVTVLAACHLPVSRAQLGLQRPRVVPLLVGSFITVTVVVAMAVATSPGTRTPTGWQLAGGVLLFAAFTAPAEELLFRGLLYGLVEQEQGALAATVVTAVSFAFVHVPAYGLASIPVATAAGLLFGWLRYWCRSLAGPWFVHSTADLALLWL